MGRKELPYPPSPEDIPDDFRRVSGKFVFIATLLVGTLFLFLLVYLGLMGLCIYGMIWGVTASVSWFIKVPVIIVALIFFLFLVKGFFIHDTHDRTGLIEVTEEDHPELHEFIERLCDELQAPLPYRIYVSPEVNAAVMFRLSLINLFVPARRDLFIGLGLVNSLNLSELKAVIGHELGHFSQKGFIDSYAYIARSVIASILLGNDWLDNAVDQVRRRDDALAFVGDAIYWPLWILKKLLIGIFRVINFLDISVARQREFNADLAAVSVAGSDAIVHALKRIEFAFDSLMQASHDLETAADHDLYSDNLFLHQTAAGVYLRKLRKEPKLGQPPEFKPGEDGRDVQVFNAEEHGHAPMWDYHPSLFDREENAKRAYIPAMLDKRPAWVLFGGDREELKRRSTQKFYRQVFRKKKNIRLSDASEVQKFINDEHAEMTYDPRYGGVYDGRLLDPGELNELDDLIDDKPWDDEALQRAESRLYIGVERRMEEYNDLKKEYHALMRDCNWAPSGRTKRIAEDLQEDIDRYRDWFREFDRRVYLVYIQMARRLLNSDKRHELHTRYRFHLPLQDLHRRALESQDKVEFFYELLFNRPPNTITHDLLSESCHEFRRARRSLKEILQDAKHINIPVLKHFTGHDSLDRFLLSEPLIKELPESYVDTKWLNKMYNQLGQVLKKSARLYFKSMGNILAIQEEIAKDYNAARARVARIQQSGARPATKEQGKG